MLRQDIFSRYSFVSENRSATQFVEIFCDACRGEPDLGNFFHIITHGCKPDILQLMEIRSPGLVLPATAFLLLTLTTFASNFGPVVPGLDALSVEH
ncbi:hypothetical protein ACP3TJ_09935 [Desulforudis sp. 1088]|uniref:hypothetical protein n=1 Tax=Desulforudis sp. 1031 TaxID=3416138 RepID=UPI003CF8851B